MQGTSGPAAATVAQAEAGTPEETGSASHRSRGVAGPFTGSSGPAAPRASDSQRTRPSPSGAPGSRPMAGLGAMRGTAVAGTAPGPRWEDAAAAGTGEEGVAAITEGRASADTTAGATTGWAPEGT